MKKCYAKVLNNQWGTDVAQKTACMAQLLKKLLSSNLSAVAQTTSKAEMLHKIAE